MSLEILKQAIVGVVKETMEKNSLTSMGMYDAVPVPEISTMQVYTCDLNYEGSGIWIFHTGSVITKTLERAQDHWSTDSVHLIEIPLETEVMWYDTEFGEISRFIINGRSKDYIRFNRNEITKV
jgi:hypothetical protein